MLGLPGSSYLYQGEELGLHEVVEITDTERQDPIFERSLGAEVGRDGCRVPPPWTDSGPSFGFGPAGSHLPQPPWFADYAVTLQQRDPGSTLELYRGALALRRALQTTERLEWLDTGRADVLRFRRPGGWEVVTNFGAEPYPLDRVDAAITSLPLDGDRLPGEATVWFAAS
jgi:alpha-glucosidase